ncbi:MAG: hypothetical protein Q8830_03150, partial [Candidatus Phytoplasma australasiaticum]|nr:hypothetical protein [Candidatus Phytoplasma australasiaticum]
AYFLNFIPNQMVPDKLNWDEVCFSTPKIDFHFSHIKKRQLFFPCVALNINYLFPNFFLRPNNMGIMVKYS